MTGPSPWRLSSPRGGVTLVTVSGSTIEPVGSIIELSVPDPWYNTRGDGDVKATPTHGRLHEPHVAGCHRLPRGLAGVGLRRAPGERPRAAPLGRGGPAVRPARARGRPQVPLLSERLRP